MLLIIFLMLKKLNLPGKTADSTRIILSKTFRWSSKVLRFVNNGQRGVENVHLSEISPEKYDV